MPIKAKKPPVPGRPTTNVKMNLNTMSLGLIRTAYTNYAPRLEEAVPGYNPMPPSDETRAIVPQSQALPEP